MKSATTCGSNWTRKCRAPTGRSTFHYRQLQNHWWWLAARSVMPRLTMMVPKLSLLLLVLHRLHWTVKLLDFRTLSNNHLGASGYVNSCFHQDPRLNIVCYPVLEKAFRHMIDSFGQANNGVLPEVIVWYRGGASTGAYQQILKNEMKGEFRVYCWNCKFLFSTASTVCYSPRWLHSADHFRSVHSKQPLKTIRQRRQGSSRRWTECTSWYGSYRFRCHPQQVRL